MATQSRIEELKMIRYSILQDESLDFIYDSDFWTDVLEEDDYETFSKSESFASATYTLKVSGVNEIWLQVMMPIGSSNGKVTVSVKSDTLSRTELDNYQCFVNDELEESCKTDFGLYNILSSHLLPLLHEYEHVAAKPTDTALQPQKEKKRRSTTYHVLFTSHHLISPKKRRSLQQWTSSLSLSGFAKIGYPGLIYAQGAQEDLEEFVSNVKAMQWLALKVRLLEELSKKHDAASLGGWQEFQRVGEVVEEMKRAGREEYVFEMGVGSS